MNLALFLILAAFVPVATVSIWRPRVAWLGGALLAADASLLLAAGRTQAGLVALFITAAWLYVFLDRRTGGAR